MTTIWIVRDLHQTNHLAKCSYMVHLMYAPKHNSGKLMVSGAIVIENEVRGQQQSFVVNQIKASEGVASVSDPISIKEKS